MTQLAFDLGQRPALDREDFLVTPANEVAVAWIDRWPDWPGPALALHGPSGCGRTHLLHVWLGTSGAVAIDPRDLDRTPPPGLLGPARAAALDDLDRALPGSPARQEALLHLYNLVAERRGHLLITGREAPGRWPIALPDLASRLAAVQAAALGAPDDTLLEALLVKLFADRQIAVAPEVIRFLSARMDRSAAAARALVEALDRRALETGRAVTVPLARAVLRDQAESEAALLSDKTGNEHP